MAEYAGLEIRIGGNTTSLNNALKASTKSAAELQSRIRQITKAMQFDPTNLGNVETRIRITGDRMQSLQTRAQITRTAMEQLGNAASGIGGKTVRQLADETENLSLTAKQADQRFSNLVDTLAKIYTAWNRSARADAVDFMKGLHIEPKDAERLMQTTTSLEEFRAELAAINKTRGDGVYQNPIITPEELARLVKFKELDFHNMFKRGLDLDDVVQSARELGVVLEDSAIENVRELQAAFKDAQREKKGYDQALQLDQMGTDVQRVDSEVESLSQTMRRLDDSLTSVGMSDEFQALETRIATVDAALDNVNRDLERTKTAMEADPSNIELAARYFNDMQQSTALANEKLGLLNQQMGMLNTDEVSDAAKKHGDLARWVETSAEEARKAQKALSDQQAAVANLDDQVKSMQQRLAEAKGDSTLAAYSDGVLKWKSETKDLATEMDLLAHEEQKVAEQRKTLATVQGNFDQATREVEEYRQQLERLKADYKQLNEQTVVALDSGTSEDELIRMHDRLGQLEAQIKEVETAYDGAKRNVTEFGRELKEQQNLVNSMERSVQTRKESVEGLRQSVDALSKTREVRLFQNPDDEIDKMQGELVELQGDLRKAQSEERKLADAYDSARTENELAKTAKKLQDVGQEANETSTDLKKMQEALDAKGGILNASTVKSLGMTLSATVTPALVGVGHSMISASSDVDSAYRDMRKTVQGTEEQFEHLRKSAIDFSRTHVTSAEQILQIEAIGGELGVATESLSTFAEVVSNIDVASNLDVEGAAEALGHLANIMHLSEDDYVGFSDALVRLGNNGASTETEIANIAERIGSMASIVGMSAPDVLAWASSIASTGQNAEAAGTAVSKTMSFFETAVASAGGTIDTSMEAIDAAVQEGGSSLVVFSNLMGQTAEEFAEAWSNDPETVFEGVNEAVGEAKNSLQGIADVAHMSASDFAKAWESDPTKVMKAFIDGLNEIEASGGSADAVLQSFGITAVRQKQAIEGLMQTVGGLDDNLQMSRDAWNGVSDQWGQAGDAANEAAKKAEGFSGQVQILSNMWQIFLAELGEGAVPIIKFVTSAVQEMSQWFSSLSQSSKTAIVAIGGIAALAGPILSFSSSIALAVGEFNKWVATSTKGIEVVKAAFDSGGQAAVNALAGTVSMMDKVKLIGSQLGGFLLKGLAAGAILVAIGLIVGKLKELYDRYQDHIAATEGLDNALASVGASAKGAVSSLEEVGMSVEDLAKESGEYESRLADLAQTISDSNKQYGNYAGQLDYYANVVGELGGKANLTQDEAYKLEAALSAVNEACNTNYGLDEYGNLIDTQTGKIQENTDVIQANIEARKQQAVIDYYADDYAQAVGENAEAQDRLNAAQEESHKIVADMNRDLETVGDNEAERIRLVFEYQDKLHAAMSAERDARAEVQRTQEVIDVLDGKIANATEGLQKANQTIDDAAKAQQEFDLRTQTVTADVTGNMKRMSDAIAASGKTDMDFNFITDGLSAISVFANEMGGVDMSALVSAFTSVDSSMLDVVATLEAGGVQMTTWNAALEQAPGAAENMGSVTAAAFQSMYEVAGGSIDDTMTLIAGLDTVRVEDKTFYVGDNGSIVDEQGKIYNINTDLASIPPEVITSLYVNDEGARQQALDAKAALSDVGEQKPTPTINVKDNATKPAETLQSKLNDLSAYSASPSAYLNDYASDPIYGIIRALRELDGMQSNATATVTTVKKTVEQATGGMNSRPVIPRHATGYIATGPTLTNQGWIGEDGVEAVANWATGGAVVPLTNKRYMLPIADAIAEGMAARGYDKGGSNITVQLNYSAGDDANKMARDLARALGRIQRTGR